MEIILIKILQFILAISLLIFIHELGHFGFARLFRVRVDKFYMFFNPSFSIVRFKKINGKYQFKWFAKNDPDHVMQATDENGELRTDKKGNPIMVPAPIEELADDDWRKYPETTEWGLGWLPLGGYCKIAGMIDESMDTSLMNVDPQPWEYRAQKAWKRMLIIVGGVLMNLVGAIVIYSMMLFTWGEEYIPVSNAYMGYDYCPTALENGFVNGDRIISIEGVDIEQSREALQKIVIEGKQNVVVQRGEEQIALNLPKDFGNQFLAAENQWFMVERFPFVVGDIMEGSLAERIRLEPGDSIIGINGVYNSTFSDLRLMLDTLKNSTVILGFIRGNLIINKSFILPEDGQLGVSIQDPTQFFESKRTEYGFFQSIPAGAKLGWKTLVNYVKQFRLVFSKEGAQSLGGFIAIGNIFPSVWDWSVFWSLTAMLSIMLAFMNILPIPALDGGYLLMIIYEMITGRKPSDKFMEIALNIGMFLLLALLIFANGNDIIKLFTK